MGIFSKSLLGRMMRRHSGLADKIGLPTPGMPPGFGDDRGRGGGAGPQLDPAVGDQLVGGIRDEVVPAPTDPTVSASGGEFPVEPAPAPTRRDIVRQWAEARTAAPDRAGRQDARATAMEALAGLPDQGKPQVGGGRMRVPFWDEGFNKSIPNPMGEGGGAVPTDAERMQSYLPPGEAAPSGPPMMEQPKFRHPLGMRGSRRFEQLSDAGDDFRKPLPINPRLLGRRGNVDGRMRNLVSAVTGSMGR